MTRKTQTLRHDDVANLMSHLADLPERKRSPEDAVSLSTLFRSKVYMSEIKSALGKGYTFADLSKIFSERCSVSVSERQIKYHYTRAMNLRGKKSAPVRKPRQETVPKDTGEVAESNAEAIASDADSSQIPPDSAIKSGEPTGAESDARSYGMNPRSWFKGI